MTTSVVPHLLQQYESEILQDWLREMSSATRRNDLLNDTELREQSRRVLSAIQQASQRGYTQDVSGPEWTPVRELLSTISASRARQGFTASETATFVFALKKPVFARIQRELSKDPEKAQQESWSISELIDKLGLYTVEIFMKSREEVIIRQQQEMLELSTPVVKLWDGILALPLIGTLDSARTQVVMESLLQKVVETGSEVAIIDITGVPTVDTLVAQHLLKTVTAARLMGADCIISGIRPQIAQTIVHLGVALGDVTTKSSLADAFVLALERTGAALGKNKRNKAKQHSANNTDETED